MKTPQIGGRAKLYLQKYAISGGDYETFDAFYLGKKPVEIEWYLEPRTTEGHVFARKKNEKVELYHTRTNTLNEVWLSDGDDESNYFAGIEVFRVKENLISDDERKYLEDKIQKWGAQKLAA